MERDRGGRPRYPGIITPSEQRVLEELRKGGTNAEIAVRLGIGPETVKTHIANMLEKLDLADRRQLAVWRPKTGRGRLRALLALPATAASVGRPLAWVGASLVVTAGLVAVVLVVGLAGGWAWLTDGEHEDLAVAPSAFAGTLTIRGERYDHDRITLPAGVVTTITLDNWDAGVAHNIVLFDFGSAVEHGRVVGGCLSGCADGGRELRLALVEGPVRQTFTFITPLQPGEYGFWCDVHPDTMVGVLVIAAPPGP